MSAKQELIAAVRARTEGTPYKLEETADGFDVGVDLANVKYYSLMYQQKLEKTFTYRVKLDESDKSMSITDDTFELSWRKGADVSDGVPKPSLGARITRAQGRFETRSFEKTYAVNEQGEFGKVVDFTFNSSEGRDLIREPAAELGWSEHAGTAQRIGLAVAIAGGVLALVVVVLLLILL